MNSKNINITRNTCSLLFFAAWLAGCTVQSSDSANELALKKVPVMEVVSLDTTIYNVYVADIQAIKNVEVRSRLQGFLEKIYVDEGDEVRQGQPLFKINEDEYRSEVVRAEAVLNNAIADAETVSLEVERTKLLVDKNIISKTDLDVAQAQFNAAKSRVEEAQSLLQHAKTRLSYTTIRSPFNGRIDRIPLKEGSLLNEGSFLTSVSDLKEVYAYFDISEQEYLNILSDQQKSSMDFSTAVKLTLANGDDYPYTGSAEFAENEFEASTGTISLRARFPNPSGLLKHGASGKIAIPLQTGENLVVHQKSVFEIQDRTYVYLVSNNNTVAMTPFQAGQRIGHYYLVESGLKAQDKIVYEGVQSLRDGMEITPELTVLP